MYITMDACLNTLIDTGKVYLGGEITNYIVGSSIINSTACAIAVIAFKCLSPVMEEAIKQLPGEVSYWGLIPLSFKAVVIECSCLGVTSIACYFLGITFTCPIWLTALGGVSMLVVALIGITNKIIELSYTKNIPKTPNIPEDQQITACFQGNRSVNRVITFKYKRAGSSLDGNEYQVRIINNPRENRADISALNYYGIPWDVFDSIYRMVVRAKGGGLICEHNGTRRRFSRAY